MSRVELWLTTLSAYGCDAFAFHKERTVPLWHNDFGYEAVGLDLLVQRCNAWYARRAQERRIKPGDRVAVLGRGIAVVEIAGDNQVHAVLWNTNMVRIGHKEIVWDEANMRWEANHSSVSQTKPKAMSLACTQVRQKG